MRRLLLLSAPLLLSACGEPAAPPAEPVRPVLSVVVAPRTLSDAGYAGTIQPRFSRDLAFRVLGRIVGRTVDVGQTVKAGQLLASLDATALALSVRQLEADLASAEAQRVNAAATRERQLALVERRVSAQADLDKAEEALASASGAADRARASLAKAREQLSYTQLASETDGIVTAVGAEVGQTVTAGQTVVTVAQAEIREAVVDIPDEIAQRLRPGERFEASLQVDPSIVAEGAVREVTPEADPSTRTRRVRITLEDPAPSFRIGTTVTARRKAGDLQTIELPATALLDEDGQRFVFVVDEARKIVTRRPVVVGEAVGSSFRIRSGLEIGARVVTAGVHTLKDGQAVRIGEEIVP